MGDGERERPLTVAMHTGNPNKELFSMLFSRKDCIVLPIAAKLLQICAPKKKDDRYQWPNLIHKECLYQEICSASQLRKFEPKHTKTK